MLNYNFHKTVMKSESIYNLNIINNGIYIDATFGCGGHSHEILKRLNKNGKLIAIDKDNSSFFFSRYIKDKRFSINFICFSNLIKHIKKNNLIGKVNGIILDLGLSSYQIFNGNRGFSFLRNEILDMRINKNIGIPAYKWLKKSNKTEIENVFKNFGNEYKYSKKISEYIHNYNKKNNIITTFDFLNIIKKFHKKKNKKINIATKYFQSIRIFINNELINIQKFLKNVINILDLHGRLVIISFNSLETKIIKNFFKKDNLSHLSDIPINENEKNIILKNNKDFYIKKILKLKPTIEEINYNNRSRSAILHVFEKQKVIK